MSFTTVLNALSRAVRNRGSSLNASFTRSLKRRNSFSNRSTYFSESCVMISAASTISANPACTIISLRTIESSAWVGFFEELLLLLLLVLADAQAAELWLVPAPVAVADDEEEEDAPAPEDETEDELPLLCRQLSSFAKGNGRTSRTPASTIVSPGSIRPAGRYHLPAHDSFASCIISTSLLSFTITQATTYVTVLPTIGT
uniref:Uncharacterized protein n=1 Tax=Anopheles culicifacies TaxID=139723 RepID=A0A182M4I4_9DIPT